ncbi:MAG: glycosyltransferase family 39 protein [Candidatus Schekmanbacteria bacterium]|nr:glycosyltransferase family 39 protein [Candidatus Schekmanbacteria bacterium]
MERRVSYIKESEELWVKSLKYLLLTISVLFLLSYIATACLRINYKYELEWMEGGSLDHVLRVLNNQALYPEPDVDFIPFIYTPLYYYISAVSAKMFGLNFFALRLVSFISSILCFLLIYKMVWHETKNRFCAFLSVSLFSATYGLSGYWLDIARVDTLFLLFFLAGVYFAAFRKSFFAFFAAGIFFSLSFLTKQIALIMVIPIIIYCLFKSLRQAMLSSGIMLAVIGSSTLFFNSQSGCWYNYYIFKLPSEHPWVQDEFASYWTEDILSFLPLAFFIGLFCLVRRMYVNRRLDIWLFAFLSMIGGSYFSMLHSGGWKNVLLPAYAVISILFGIGINELLKLSMQLTGNKLQAAKACIYLLSIFQMSWLVYNPAAQIPSKEDEQCGEKLVHFISEIKGEVYIPAHGYLSMFAGKKAYAQRMAVEDVISGDDKNRRLFVRHLTTAIREQRFDLMILEEEDSFFEKIVDGNYIYIGDFFKEPDGFFPVTGARTRPLRMYIPRKLVEGIKGMDRLNNL